MLYRPQSVTQLCFLLCTPHTLERLASPWLWQKMLSSFFIKREYLFTITISCLQQHSLHLKGIVVLRHPQISCLGRKCRCLCVGIGRKCTHIDFFRWAFFYVAEVRFAAGPVHSSTVLSICAGTAVCFPKLGPRQPPPTASNTPALDKYLIQPHFKKSELSL